MVIDYPKHNTSISQNFIISGWAADLVNKKPVKLAKVEIYNGRDRYEHNFLGIAQRFQRPDLGRKDIIDSGYMLRISLESLTGGENTLWVYAYDANNNYSLAAVKINVIKEASGDGGDGNEVTVENVKPTANPGGPYTATAGKEMTFDGSASTDSDGSIAEYTWNFGDNSTGTGAKPVHTYAAAGTYTVTLTVKDNSGASSDAKTTTVTVTVEVKIVVSREIGRYSGVFTMVIDTPRNNESISQDFVFSGWAADLVNKKPVKLAKVEIYNGRERYEHNLLWTASIFQRPDLGRKDILDSGYSLRISLKSLMAGENTLWVYAYDASNNYSLTAVKINVIKEASGDGGDGNEVTVENVKPTANLGGPYTATAGKEMTFDGSASTDSDGSIAEYTWNFGDNSTGTGAKPVHTYAAAGTYTVTLTVKDNSGASSDAKTTTA